MINQLKKAALQRRFPELQFMTIRTRLWIQTILSIFSILLVAGLFLFTQSALQQIQGLIAEGYGAVDSWNQFSHSTKEILITPQTIAKHAAVWKTNREQALEEMSQFLNNQRFTSTDEQIQQNIGQLQSQLATIGENSARAVDQLDAYQAAIESGREISGGLSYKLGFYQASRDTQNPIFMTGRQLERTLLNLLPATVNFEGGLSMLFSALEDQVSATAASMPRLIAIVFAIFTAIIFLLSVLIVRSILKSVTRLQAGVSRASQLDLTVRFEPGKDELGQLGAELNGLLENMCSVIADLRGFAHSSSDNDRKLAENVDGVRSLLNTNREHMHNLEFSAVSLRDQITEVKNKTGSIAKSIGTISDFTEDQSAAADESSAAIEEMEASLRRIAEIISTRQEDLEQLSQSTRQSQEQGRLATETISSVASDIDRLNEILSVIATVASQTSLLSMNAAIESAHAGDAGRGFAVVAEEIRKLAETTTERSKEIRQNLKNIIGKIKSAEEVSQENYRYLEESAALLDSFVQAMQEVQQSTTEVSTGSQQVLSAATELSSSVGKSRESAQEILSSIREIEGTVQSVDEFSSKLNGRVGEMLDHSGNILKGVDQVAQIQESAGKDIRELGSRVDRFKTDSDLDPVGDEAEPAQ
jgi:methyl-accepting chemotaxis protein